MSSPIVVIDSGLGGLTVAKALRQALPKEDLVYFGDTARLPYGSKTAGAVTGFVQQIIDYLAPCQPKHIVIACNTASALALPALRQSRPDLSISGVIEPGSKAAVVAAGRKLKPIIGVLATEATVRSKAYEAAIGRRRFHAKVLLQQAPLLVPMIEEGRSDSDPLVRMALEGYLEAMKSKKPSVLVLGCTHYPVYARLIREIVGDAVRVIDSASQCADDVAARLGPGVAIAGSETSASTGTLHCYVTDDPAKFQKLAPRFLGQEIELPSLVDLQELYVPPRQPMRVTIPA